jgi:hypothetical protein
MVHSVVREFWRFLGSKNVIVDAALIFSGFVVLGAASALGTIVMKYVWNNYLIYEIPNAEKVPY